MLYDDPNKANNEPLIIKTLLQLKNDGKVKKTMECFASHLKLINQNANINDPESVKAYISNLNRDPQTKNSYAVAYDWYCRTNGIQWKKPYFKWERKIPMIPTAANIDKIISASSQKYATIFTILKEHGLEAHELATVTRDDIDQERGIINIRGCKGHNSRSIKLNTKTAEMLRVYLQRNTGNAPFPNSHAMGEEWRATRKKVARNLGQSELTKIPMRNLRHHFATQKYDQTKDILLVKSLLGHKKLETTLFYTQLICFNENEEYTCKAAKTVEEATALIESNFQYVTEIDGTKLFRKRK